MTRIHLDLTLGTEDSEPGKSSYFDVQESFEQVMDHIVPLNNPSSALEHRSTMLYTSEEGKQVFISGRNIVVAEEQ